jgi:recombination protein RecA
MNELKSVLAKLKKDFGEGVAVVGGGHEAVDRIPTGIFQFDLATGGGIPTGKVTIIYGSESSGKTTLTLKLIAYVQRVMKKKAVFVDLENSLDLQWAELCGVIVPELVVLRPESAEQVVDVVEAVMYAADVGIVIVDSLGAMTTDNEITSGAEKVIVGGAALIVGKLIRKSTIAMNVQRKQKHFPTLVLINQIRIKIGVMYGDPETTPGGNAVRFASSLSVRLYGKDKIIKEIHPTLPTFKEVSAIIKKWKVPIVSRSFEYELCLVPHEGLSLLESPSWNTVSGFLKKHEVIRKEGTRWLCMDTEFPALGAIQQAYEQSPDLRLALQQEVVALEMKKPIAPQPPPEKKKNAQPVPSAESEK